MMDSFTPDLTENANIVVNAEGILSFGGRTYRAAIGKAGMRCDKCEGDGASPVGIWQLRYVMYRADRVAPPRTGLPVYPLTPDDGWCDDPHNRAYNRPVRLPFADRYENLWREDHVYDLIVTLGHNDDPALPGNGSAIFMHIARPDYDGTEGCVALAQDDLEAILADSGVYTHLCIDRK
jgi:L,D-peptidoglycan transpeptidase YkuD (ErfK/YbiS/YcfS/YnhG family)